MILEYLTQEGFAYRQDIADLLGVDVRQCRSILQRMVKAGKLTQKQQRYTLNLNLDISHAAFRGVPVEKEI
jgi:DNA-binding IclR family transcriptional regulator